FDERVNPFACPALHRIRIVRMSGVNEPLRALAILLQTGPRWQRQRVHTKLLSEEIAWCPLVSGVKELVRQSYGFSCDPTTGGHGPFRGLGAPLGATSEIIRACQPGQAASDQRYRSRTILR